MKISFRIPYHTKWGEKIVVVGNIAELGADSAENGLSLSTSGDDIWYGSIELKKIPELFTYKYLLFDENSNKYSAEWDVREVELKGVEKDVVCFDLWNNINSVDNVLMTSPFQNVFFNSKKRSYKIKNEKSISHIFKVKSPVIGKDQAVCLIGDIKELGNWAVDKAIVLKKGTNEWFIELDITSKVDRIHYKYGIYDTKAKHFLYFEQGGDRLVEVSSKELVIANDGFFRGGDYNWRGAGVGLPVSSIRTRNSFGVGDFIDIKLLVDWASHVGLKLIQFLPLNDTIGTHSDLDILPYAAISAFALNPLYLNLPALGEMPKNSSLAKQYTPKQAELNALELMPFLDIINFKLGYAKEAYLYQKKDFLEDKEFKSFFAENQYWLVPYAAYCVLRDRYQTNDYLKWEKYKDYDEKTIKDFVDPKQSHFDEVALNYYIQFHLHKQLQEAGKYANEHQVILKGDIPIGVNRNSVDTWVNPELYHMGMNAGAPPDMFAVKGQNWSLPTYNWEAMKASDFKWWKQRFSQMSNYFDTFRIDHILGFFRIWQIPLEQVEGIMGHLNPSIPIYINEFAEKGIHFDYNRFCKPYITDHLVDSIFGDEAAWIRANALQIEDGWILRLRTEFTSQSYVEQLFEKGEISERVKYGLFDLISNVLFFEVENSNGTQFFPRFGMHSLNTFQELDEHSKKGLDELYVHYFYHRQNDFWYHTGMEKLPELKKASNMLICGEDLGMMNPAVSAVMKDLGILSLEVQRASKNEEYEFAHPDYAPYLSVVTPSTHDMSTVRGWWEEDREVTQRFYNEQLGHWGEAPYFCEWWISRDIVLQHLYSPAMWAIFQLQDLLGVSEKIRRENPHDERINVPSNSKASWRYRMHISVESLLEEHQFNDELRNYIVQSGR